jgi:hypothetical protein
MTTRPFASLKAWASPHTEVSSTTVKQGQTNRRRPANPHISSNSGVF